VVISKTVSILLQVAVGFGPVALCTYAFIKVRYLTPRVARVTGGNPALLDSNPARTAAICFIAGFGVAAFAALILWMGLRMYDFHAYMRERGIAAEAVLTNRRVEGNAMTGGHSFYVQYRFPITQGDRVSQVTSEDEVSALDDSRLSIGQRVPIRYDPAKPTISALYFQGNRTSFQIFMDVMVLPAIAAAALGTIAVAFLATSVSAFRRSRLR
jgi:hypothetical protein